MQTSNSEGYQLSITCLQFLTLPPPCETPHPRVKRLGGIGFFGDGVHTYLNAQWVTHRGVSRYHKVSHFGVKSIKCSRAQMGT